ncbi:hypothetical protein PIROE2DRAFT_64351 [Piromyces sp. E2]|nr:hypothetical protein PIROE2DRAFT_64351 [Piromyces sp. E2]|eukprot:OUM58522.1 hypothetical protein PIROE2DRAFT_64351 [Piromyces sp. E2]
MSKNKADSEKELENIEAKKINNDEKLASHRTSYFVTKHKSSYSTLSAKRNSIILKEDSLSVIDERPQSSNISKLSSTSDTTTTTTTSSTSSHGRRRSNSITSPKIILEVEKEPNNSLTVPSLSLQNSKISNDQSDIFMVPQIILSFQDEDLDQDENLDEGNNNKILYNSNEGYQIGEEKPVNHFEDLDKIINFGDEREPETDGFSIMRSKKHNEVIKEDGGELEEKRKNSIKYADSDVNFNKYDYGDKKENKVVTLKGGDESSKNGKDLKIQMLKSDSRNTSKRSSISIEKPTTPDTPTNEEVSDEENSPGPVKKASLQTPSLTQSFNKRGRRYSAMPFVPVKDSKITSENIETNKDIMALPSELLNTKQNIYTDKASPSISKYTISLKEFIPQRGLLYSEFQQFHSGWVLCKPKLLPLKSLEIQKIEKLEKAVYKARQNTGMRLTRTASLHSGQPNTKLTTTTTTETHTSPADITINS